MKLFERLLTLQSSAACIIALNYHGLMDLMVWPECWSMTFDRCLYWTAFIILIHLSSEGYRWQLMPMYIVLISQSLVYGLYGFDATVRQSMSISMTYHLYSNLLQLTFLAGSWILAYLFPIHALPTSRGFYRIATLTTNWTSSQRARNSYYSRYDFEETNYADRLEEIMVRLQWWYPCQAPPKDELVNNTPLFSMDKTKAALSYWCDLPGWMFSHLSSYRSRAFQTLSVKPIAPAEQMQQLPILLVLEESGPYADGSHHRLICEEMASEGWLVIRVQHTDCGLRSPVNSPLFPETTPLTTAEGAIVQLSKEEEDDDLRDDENLKAQDRLAFERLEGQKGQTLADRRRHQHFERALQRRAREIEFILDRLMMMNYGEVPDVIFDTIDDNQEEIDKLTRTFKGHFDLERIVILGHSFSASVAIHAASVDRRLSAAICLDAWTWPLSKEMAQDGIRSPLLLLQSGPSFVGNEQAPWGVDNDQEVRRLVGNTRYAYLFRFDRTTHYDFLAHAQLLNPFWTWKGLSRRSQFLDCKRMLQVSTTEVLVNYIKAFLDKCVCHRREETPQGFDVCTTKDGNLLDGQLQFEGVYMERFGWQQ